MDGARFDDWLRAIGPGFSRRTTIGAALGGLFATGSLAMAGEDAEAKKPKKGKKKKKKCKKGKKKCGKTCIAADACCGGCQGDQICDGGACTCPDETPVPCPGGACVQDGGCCNDAECGGGLSCTEGFCVCPGQNDITCADVCCQSTEDEICNILAEPQPACQAGGCVANDWCNGSDFFLCANSLDSACVCLTTADPVPETACVNYFEVGEDANCSAACSSSADCPGDDVCVPGNISPEGFCLCDNNFCAARCDGGTERRRSEQNGAKALADMRKKKFSR